MPRNSREYNSTTKLYHVIIKGIDGQDIFWEDKDKNKFLKELVSAKEKYRYDLCAYCLMDNHVHLIIYDKEEQLSKIMQSIEISYSSYFNKKYERQGHLFQNRFFSKKIESKEYFQRVCCYVHHNPIHANLKNGQNDKWNSLREYETQEEIIKEDILLATFDTNKQKAKQKLKQYQEERKKDTISNKIEFEFKNKLTDLEAKEYLQEISGMEELQKIKELTKEEKKKMIEKLCERSILPMAQIARILGINRKIIERIRKCPKQKRP